MKSASRKPQPKRKYFKSRGFSRLFCFSWEQRKLGDVVQITMGQSPDGTTYSDEPSDYILVQGNADLQNGWVCPRIWTTQITKKADAGDLIMSVRAPAGAMGKTAYNAVIGRGVAAIKGNEFIYQLLVKMDMDGFWKTLSCGSTFESLNSDNIKNAEVKVPTTAEQVQIGDFFRHLDNLITLHQRDSIMRFFGAWDNANAWEQRKLGEIGSVSMCRRIFKEQTSETGDIPFYKIGTFGADPDAFISRELFEEYKSKYPYPQKGDILISASGSIGRTVEFAGNNEYFQDSNIVWLNHDERLSNPFLKCFYSVVKWAGIEGSTIKRLYNDNILNTVICMPSVPEQKRIGLFFENLDNLITLHQRERKNRLFGGKNVKQYNFSRLVLQLLRAMDSRLQRRGSSQGDYG